MPVLLILRYHKGTRGAVLVVQASRIPHRPDQLTTRNLSIYEIDCTLRGLLDRLSLAILPYELEGKAKMPRGRRKETTSVTHHGHGPALRRRRI